MKLRPAVTMLAAAAMTVALPVLAQSSDLLAFVSIRSGDPHIHLYSDGVDRAITQGPGVHTHPALSSEGRVAFLKSVGGVTRVFVTGPMGAEPRRLNTGDRMEFGPSWSPDGRSLAYYSADPSQPGTELRIVDLASGAAVTVRAAGSEMGPHPVTWSADGSKLAFLAHDAKGQKQVHVVRRDGTGLSNVSGSYSDRNKGSAEISPDGSKVVFTADARQRRPIVLVDLASGKATELTPQPEAAYEIARWSPDGRQLAVVRVAQFELPDARNDIFVMNADGSGLRNLSNHPAEDFDPRWSSDGRSIVFASLRGGTSQLYRAGLLNGRTEVVSRGHRSHDMDHVVRGLPQ
jgi:TolB protein